MRRRRHNIQHNDIKNNDTQLNGILHEGLNCNTKHNDSVKALSAIMLSFVMMSVAFSFVMLSVIILNVMAPMSSMQADM
jgi:hypothetical protein